jgi:CBS domain-containing protein
LGLVTDPDFESVWIDGKIRIRLNDGGAIATAPATGVGIGEDDEGASVEEQDETDSPQLGSEDATQPSIVVATEGVVETVLSEPADPTFRIGSLPAANKALTTVGQDDPLNKAVTMMLQFDYSQLPIMHGEREVKGMISWKSIASRYAIGGESCKVQHCREDAQVVDGNGTLFDAIPTIVTRLRARSKSPRQKDHRNSHRIRSKSSIPAIGRAVPAVEGDRTSHPATAARQGFDGRLGLARVSG